MTRGFRLHMRRIRVESKKRVFSNTTRQPRPNKARVLIALASTLQIQAMHARAASIRSIGGKREVWDLRGENHAGGRIGKSAAFCFRVGVTSLYISVGCIAFVYPAMRW